MTGPVWRALRWRAWPRLGGADDGSFPADQRGVAAAEVALEAEAEPEMLEAAGFAGAAWLERVRGATRGALALVERVVDALPPGYAADPGFLRLGVECANSRWRSWSAGAVACVPHPRRPGRMTWARAGSMPHSICAVPSGSRERAPSLPPRISSGAR